MLNKILRKKKFFNSQDEKNVLIDNVQTFMDAIKNLYSAVISAEYYQNIRTCLVV